jgi:hypothetical protein
MHTRAAIYSNNVGSVFLTAESGFSIERNS